MSRALLTIFTTITLNTFMLLPVTCDAFYKCRVSTRAGVLPSYLLITPVTCPWAVPIKILNTTNNETRKCLVRAPGGSGEPRDPGGPVFRAAFILQNTVKSTLLQCSKKKEKEKSEHYFFQTNVNS